MDRYSNIVEERLLEAVERGEFDDLPGAGRHLRLGEDSADWWARRKLAELKRHDQLIEAARGLERERDQLWSLPDETSVREAARRLNQRTRQFNRDARPDEEISLVDPETAVITWRRMERLRSS